MMNVSFSLSPLKSGLVCSTAPKLDSIESFKCKGFIPLNDQILKGTDQVYIYFFQGKPLIMVSCDLLKNSSGFCDYDSILINRTPENWNLIVQMQKIDNGVKCSQDILLDGKTLPTVLPSRTYSAWGQHKIPLSELPCIFKE